MEIKILLVVVFIAVAVGVGVGASVGSGVGSAVGTAVGSLVGRGVVSGAALVPHAERMPSAAISMAAARRFVLLLMGCSP